MKKWIAIILAFCMLFGVTACGGQEAGNTAAAGQDGEGQTINAETTLAAIEDDAETESFLIQQSDSNILIAYFTWADNTVVDDSEAAIQSALSHYESVGDSSDYSGVDATTSASVIPHGNTAKLAGWIQQYMGGDLFSIKVVEPYPSDYDECLDRAADEKAVQARPELMEHVENMEQYDTIFLGFPNWWYTAPMAVFSFIEEYDLSGKTIVPFCAHGTGGLASSVLDITEALPDSAKVLGPIGIYRSEINSAQSSINAWLEGLGFPQNESEENNEQEIELMSERKIKMTVDGQEIMITLYDTPAANALYEMLPLELTFEDFNRVEKISYLPEKLPTEGEPDGCDPDVGDFCLYAPWGNLSIFYQDFRYSESLIMLGHIESGMDVVSDREEDFSAVIEKTE